MLDWEYCNCGCHDMPGVKHVMACCSRTYEQKDGHGEWPPDIHMETASKMFSVPVEAVTTEQRRLAKAVNYETLYGKQQKEETNGTQG